MPRGPGDAPTPAFLVLVGPRSFEGWCRQARLEGREGEVVPIDRWEGHLRPAERSRRVDLFLATVRPDPERLWLVAALEGAARVKGRWVALANRAPIVDLGPVIPSFSFASGRGLRSRFAPLGERIGRVRVLSTGDVFQLVEAIVRAKGPRIGAVGGAREARPRPARVPPEAVWSELEREWVVGAESGGRRQGLFRFYRPDGTLVSESTYVDGEATGAYRRFHENGEISQEGTLVAGKRVGVCRWQGSRGPTTEVTRSAASPANQWSGEQELDEAAGVVRWQRFRDREGREICPLTGAIAPSRPAGLDARAWFQPSSLGPDEHAWVLGSFRIGSGVRIGPWRAWSAGGAPVMELTYDEGGIVEDRRYDPETGHLVHDHRRTGGATRTRSYDPATGRLIWSCDLVDHLQTERFYGPSDGSPEPISEWVGRIATDGVHWEERWPGTDVIRSEGAIDEGVPIGTWRFFDPAGGMLAEVRGEDLGIFTHSRADLHAVGTLLPRWLALGDPPALMAGAPLDRGALPKSHGLSSKLLRLLLRGLGSADADIRARARAELRSRLPGGGDTSYTTAAAADRILRLIEGGVPEGALAARLLAWVMTRFDLEAALGTLGSARRGKLRGLREAAAVVQAHGRSLRRLVERGDAALAHACSLVVPLVAEDRGAAARTLLHASQRMDLAPEARVDAALGLALAPESPARERALDRLVARAEPAVRFAAALGRLRTLGGALAAAERVAREAGQHPDSLGAYRIACYGGDPGSVAARALGPARK
ncbi:MAG: hypothetical protein HYY06_32815 [Deltaproteobacteria bacterium]|nr:hypothetical protein [Deltaproteobacteria bacterium]